MTVTHPTKVWSIYVTTCHSNSPDFQSGYVPGLRACLRVEGRPRPELNAYLTPHTKFYHTYGHIILDQWISPL